MKVAVPTNDGTSISDHFGRSSAFLVFDIEDGKVSGRSLRPNNGCHPNQGDACHNDSHATQPHSHAAIVAAIADCQLVLCGGMGQRASDALTAHGISPVFVRGTGPAEGIVEAYLAGTLKPETTSGCRCSH